MTDLVMIMHLLVSLVLSLIIGLEREYRNEPAWIRTHILIWVGSTLFMIISVKVPEFYNASINDPGRIAAQVVSWVWFIWAWAIMKMWLNTKGLTTAANIWVVSAVWLAVWTWLYLIAVFVTWLILINLVFVTAMKSRFLKAKRYSSIYIKFKKSDKNEAKIMETVENLPLKVLTKNIKDNYKTVSIRLLVQINSKVDIFFINKAFKDIKDVSEISISESVKW
jgi:putative Mg2+ transporter-C (MgtC) family protein